jgi:hypothetical protein
MWRVLLCVHVHIRHSRHCIQIVLVDHPTSTWRTAKLGYVIGLADRKAQRATGREFCKKAKPFSVLTEAGMGIG